MVRGKLSSTAFDFGLGFDLTYECNFPSTNLNTNINIASKEKIIFRKETLFLLTFCKWVGKSRKNDYTLIIKQLIYIRFI